MTTYQLRPMSIGEILDAGFTIYRRRFLTFVGIGVLGYGAGAVVLTYVEFSDGMLEHLGLAFFAYLVLLPIGGLFASAASVYVISETFLGREPAFKAAVAYAKGRMWPLMVAGTAGLMLVFVGLVLFLIPGIIVALAYAVLSQVVILERPQSSMTALPRSWELTKGHRGRAFVLIIVAVLLVSLLIIGIGLVVAFVPSLQHEAAIATHIVQVSTYPILPTMLTLLYYDLRVRKEGFDLEVLSQQLKAGAPA
jgi:uncharacterized membrane protein